MNVGSLFSGIGGLDLGLERAGMTVAWQAETDPFASLVLRTHWPDVPNHGDVNHVDWSAVAPVDLLCGGYPCQPFSLAGARLGHDDPRHLWPAFARAVRVVRPRWALLENVPGHLSLGFGHVLGELADCGMDAAWDCLPASAVGAPHLRYRLFVVAHSGGGAAPLAVWRRIRAALDVADADPERRDGRAGLLRSGRGAQPPDGGAALADAERHAVGAQAAGGRDAVRPGPDPDADAPRRGAAVAHADRERAEVAGRERGAVPRSGAELRPQRRGRTLADSVREGLEEQQRERGHDGQERPPAQRDGDGWSWWAVEPDVGRVAHGVPARVDRLRALGNAVVPQVAELIGLAIMAEEAAA